MRLPEEARDWSSACKARVIVSESPSSVMELRLSSLAKIIARLGATASTSATIWGRGIFSIVINLQKRSVGRSPCCCRLGIGIHWSYLHWLHPIEVLQLLLSSGSNLADRNGWGANSDLIPSLPKKPSYHAVLAVENPPNSLSVWTSMHYQIPIPQSSCFRKHMPLD